MANQPLQQQLQQQLNQLRHQERTFSVPNTSDTEPAEMPQWLDRLKTDPSAYNQQTQVLIHDLEQLLNQLPLVANTHHTIAIQTYFKTVVTELTKLYYVRMSLVIAGEHDEILKQKHLDALETELQTTIQEIATLLEPSYASHS